MPRWVRLLLGNLGAVAVALVVLVAIEKTSDAYNWTWEKYVVKNLKVISPKLHVPLEGRLTSKLGADLGYLIFIRNTTPTNAVIYYPTMADFTTPPPDKEKSIFNGRLHEKLIAVRFLYPRRVVVESELGVTSWSKKLTHICIVNGHNRDMLPYQTEDDLYNEALPTDSLLMTPL